MVRVVTVRVLQARPPPERKLLMVMMVGRTMVALLPAGDLTQAAAAARMVTDRLELKPSQTRLPH